MAFAAVFIFTWPDSVSGQVRQVRTIGQLEAGDLAARVHSGVSSTGNGESYRLPQDLA